MASNAKNVFEYMTLIGKLKRVRRTGWVLRGVSDPESVSDHMYRVAMTALLAPPPLNADKCVKMALVHDMAECIVGDLTPHDNVSKEEKHRREDNATQKLCSLVGESVGSHLYALWQEYEAQETEEAHFVKDLDRLEMVQQAFEYEQEKQCPCCLQEFFDSTEGKFKTQTVRALYDHLKCLRREDLNLQDPQPPTNQISRHSPDAPQTNQSACSENGSPSGVVADSGEGSDDGETRKRRRVMETDSEKALTGLAGDEVAGDVESAAGRTGNDSTSTTR